MLDKAKDIKNELYLMLAKEDHSSKTAPKMVVSNVMDKCFVLLQDPELVKEFTINKYEKYTKWKELLFIDLLFEEGLFMLSGEKWKRHRQIFQPYFTFEAIKKRVSTIKKCACELVTHIHELNAKKAIDTPRTAE
jgi:cytochrome P450